MFVIYQNEFINLILIFECRRQFTYKTTVYEFFASFECKTQNYLQLLQGEQSSKRLGSQPLNLVVI